MTVEQKKEWLSKATGDEVIEQLIRAARSFGRTIAEQIEAAEDVRLCRAELKKRMEG